MASTIRNIRSPSRKLTLPILLALAIVLIAGSAAADPATDGINDPVFGIIVDQEACIEDTPCVFTLGADDPDPGDLHEWHVLGTPLIGLGSLHQYDDGMPDNVGAAIPAGTTLVTDSLARIVYVPNNNAHSFGEPLNMPSFSFRVTETNTAIPWTDDTIIPAFDVAPTDDPPVTSTFGTIVASDFPDDDPTPYVQLGLAVTQIDFPVDALELTFSQLPIAPGEGEVRVGATFAAAVPVVLGVPYACTFSNCGQQFWYAADNGVIAFASNTQIADIQYSVRDVSTTTPYVGAGFLGAASATALFSITTNPNPGLRFVSVLSGPSAFDEGVHATTHDIVLRFAQPESVPASDPSLSVMAYPTRLTSGDDSPHSHGYGVVFPSTANRGGTYADVSFHSPTQTDCSPQPSCPGLDAGQGSNLRYSPVCDANFCDFTVTVRACTPAEAADGCNADFAGETEIAFEARTAPGGNITTGQTPLLVNNDEQDFMISVPDVDCNATTPYNYTLDTEGFAISRPFSGYLCNPLTGNFFLPPGTIISGTFDHFQTDLHNDGLEESTTVWRVEIEFYTPAQYAPTSTYILGLGAPDSRLFDDASVTEFVGLELLDTTGVTVTSANPALTYFGSPSTLVFEAPDLLALRLALSSGVQLSTEFRHEDLRRSLIVTKLSADTGSSFVEVALAGQLIGYSPNPNPPEVAPEYCGDGVVQTARSEACDDGNTVNDDGCSNQCVVEVCGDGAVQASLGETCDDGNTAGGDGCSAICVAEMCGNSVLDAGEQCDDGNAISGDGCSDLCAGEYCGDGLTHAGIGEACDDGNTVGGDGCSYSCQVEVCGDGTLDVGEQCDDANISSDDGCDAACFIEYCGDAITQAGIGEVCDDGNAVGGDLCSATCQVELCGNGVTDVGEQCDDANLIEDDGCDQFCVAGFCGDAVFQPAIGEQCEDGNGVGGDGCSATCLVEVCGDGYLDVGEDCDDGNLLNGDLCDSFCRDEITIPLASAPPGLVGGDTFHYILVTAGVTDGLAHDVNFYHSFANVEANSGALPGVIGGPLSWRAAVSTGTVVARDAAPVGATSPVYNTQHQLIATGYADLWDGSLAYPVEFDQHGVSVGEALVLTGTQADGDAAPSRTLGDCTFAAAGNSEGTGSNWIDDPGLNPHWTEDGPIYVISREITVIGAGAQVPTMGLKGLLALVALMAGLALPGLRQRS